MRVQTVFGFVRLVVTSMPLRVIAAAPLAGVAWTTSASARGAGHGEVVVVAKLVWQIAANGGVAACAAETPGLHRARHAPEELDASTPQTLVVRGQRTCEGRVPGRSLA